MRVLLRATLLAAAIALLITAAFEPRSLDEQLVHLQVEQEVPEYADELTAESPELQALFLVYSDDPILVSKAWVAFLRYPQLARTVLLSFGDSSIFQDVLRRYGEDILLPIHYFMTHEVATLQLMRSMNETARALADAIRSWSGTAEEAEELTSGAMTPEERGLYAIHFLDQEGYGFLRQFVLSSDGAVQWVQTDRVLESLNRFFAGGISDMERKLKQDQSLTAADVGWAALDVAVGVSAFKLLRMGRATSATRSLTLSQRSAAVGAGLWRGTLIGARVAKYGAPAVLAYMALRHPSVLNSLLADAARTFGVPVPLALWLGWSLILLPIILVLRVLLRPAGWLLLVLGRLMRGGRSYVY
ncbi:MAG TPA: hypothetical protein VKZ70_09920 [Burkholderiaceae bacterium]|nr:hypothetical protein [Burkholderiaceae bacterium]